jgi:hypothetical protein
MVGFMKDIGKTINAMAKESVQMEKVIFMKGII